MFIAHLPGGYLLTRLLLKHMDKNRLILEQRTYVAVGLVGSVFPDFDLFYFYLIDNRQHLHHSYWTHLPIVWLIVFALLFLLNRVEKLKSIVPLGIVFVSNILLHLCLDSVAGKVYWLYPWIKDRYSIFTIVPKYHWWVFNYIFHWTFFIEVCIVSAAILLYLFTKRSPLVVESKSLLSP